MEDSAWKMGYILGEAFYFWDLRGASINSFERRKIIPDGVSTHEGDGIMPVRQNYGVELFLPPCVDILNGVVFSES